MNDSNLFNNPNHTISSNSQDDSSLNTSQTDNTNIVDSAMPNSDNNLNPVEPQVNSEVSTSTSSSNVVLDPEKDLGVKPSIDSTLNSMDSTITNSPSSGLDPQKDLGVNSSVESTLSSMDSTTTNSPSSGLDPQKDLGVNTNPFVTNNEANSSDTIVNNTNNTQESNIQNSTITSGNSNPFVTDNNVTSSATDPDTIKTHWNWAGFMFNWIYIATFNGKSGLFYFLMAFISILVSGIITASLSSILGFYTIIIGVILSISVPIYLGFKGESIAWRKGKFEDQKEFYIAQKYLSKMALALFEITVAILIIYLIAIVVLVNILHIIA